MSKQKVWFITGGNKGIGAAIVKEALAQGYNVVAASRKTEEAKQNLGTHPNLLIVKLDISDDQQVEDAIKETMDKFGRIDVLVNNAGYGLLGYFEEMSEELIRRQIETNVFGTMKITRAILPIMRAQGSGFVVTVSSTSGIKSVSGGSVYSASKFALEALTDAYRNELGMLGMKVISIQPGPVKTPIWGKARQPIEKYPQTQYRQLLQQQDKLIDVTEQNALPVSDIAALVLRALEDSNPATRYLAVRNRWIIRLAGLLPDKLRDKLVMSRLRNMKKPGA